MEKRIVVLGMMRSGTSLTAELVRRWGAYAGAEDDLWKSNVNDPRGYGYMEFKPLLDLNDELLDNNDRVPMPGEVLEEKATIQMFKEKALGLLRQMDEQAAKSRFDAWVWKDARLPLTLPFWVKFWDDPIYVVTVRHPVEVIWSSAKTEKLEKESLPYSAGFLYWQFCMLNILLHTQPGRRKIFIAYDQLMQNPQDECERLARFLDAHCERSADGFQQRVDAMASQIMQSQRHHHSERSLAEMEQATREQRALYDFLRVKTLHPDETFNKNDFALYEGWREYLQSMDMLLTLSKPLDQQVQ